MGIIAIIQIILVNIGGELLRTTSIDIKSWGIVLLLAILVIPIDLVRKSLTKKKV